MRYGYGFPLNVEFGITKEPMPITEDKVKKTVAKWLKKRGFKNVEAR